MRYSKQREAILNTALWNDHPTAEQVYKIVRKSIKNVSLGTVYRDLNQLVDSGQLKKVEVPNESIHYDKTLTRHDHMYCEKCHNLFDIPSSNLIALNKSIMEETGFQILSSDVVFTGICKNCHLKEE